MSEERLGSPVQLTTHALGQAWDTMLSVYYANSVAWRVLKAGALFFFGFFLWAGSNVLLSYLPGLAVLRLTRSYGFVLVPYGPFHHLVVIPVYQRLRRQGRHLSLGDHLHLPNLSLVVFLCLVVAFTLVPVGPVALDFQSSLKGAGDAIEPTLTCVKAESTAGTTVHCHLSESKGVARVVVKSGRDTLVTDERPPFEFTVRADQLRAVTGSKRFRVNLVAEDGTLIRRYTRTLPMIERGSLASPGTLSPDLSQS